MKNLIVLLTLCFSHLVLAAESPSLDAAKLWLKLIDDGKYVESWQKSDSFFQSQVTQSKWDVALKNVRTPLGDVTSRVEISAKKYSSLPSVPKGEYLVMQFKTKFQNKLYATETLTLSKNSGNWLAIGYFIK